MVGQDVPAAAVTDWVFVGVAIAFSASCGLAWLLRSAEQITIRSVCSTLLNCGTLGAVIAFLQYPDEADEVYFIWGLCGAVSLGGVAAVRMFSKVVGTASVASIVKAISSNMAQDQEDAKDNPVDRDPPQQGS